MVSSIQEYKGISKALDRFEGRVVAYREFLQNKMLELKTNGDVELLVIATGEVEALESMIHRFSLRVTGMEPENVEWEVMDSYCSRNQSKKEGFSAGNHEYFRWALLWIQKSRNYIEYLDGVDSAIGVTSVTNSEVGNSDRDISNTSYDIALSFAGEDRKHARKIADKLLEANYSVFYDEYEQATLWGRNLYTHLSDVYQNKAKYCLMFISKRYSEKLWTKREREAAQARAFKESREYILPLRLDDTDIPGIEGTIGYLDLRTTSIDEVVHLISKKISDC